MIRWVGRIIAGLLAAAMVLVLAIYLRLNSGGPLVSLDPEVMLQQRDCGEGLPGGRCGVVLVPLDYDNPEGEKIEVGFVFFPALWPGSGRQTAVNIVGGGPGAPTVDMFRDVPLWAFRLGLWRSALMAIDPRGIGRSSRLQCRAFTTLLAPSESMAERIAACAEQLGTRRIHFSTANTARDFERVRRALGVGRYQLTAFSYGTHLAPVYARLYPHRVRSMLLDGTYPLTTFEPFLPVYYRAARRQFDMFCRRSSACEGEDAWAALAWAAGQLRRAPRTLTPPLGALVLRYDPQPMLDVSALISLTAAIPQAPAKENEASESKNQVLSSDIFIKAVIGGVLAARDRGDWRLLEEAALTLKELWTMESTFVNDNLADAERMNTALYLAIDCPESQTPWDKSLTYAERAAQLAEREHAYPADAFAPFTVAEWSRSAWTLNYYGECIHWPGHPNARPVELRHEVGGDLPDDLPVLIINGDIDMNSPLEAAVKARDHYPRAQFARFKHHGHAVIPASNCAAKMWVEFVNNGFVTDPDRCLDAEPVEYRIAP